MYLSSDGERFDTEGCVIPNGNSSTHVFYVSTNKTCDCHLLAYPVIRDQSIHSRALFRDDCWLCFFPRKWLTTSDTDCNVTLSYTSHFWCATQHPAQYGVPFLSKNKLSLLLQEAHTNVKAGDTSGGVASLSHASSIYVSLNFIRHYICGDQSPATSIVESFE